MEGQATEVLLRFFRGIPDRRASNARHSLSDVLSIAILAVLCGSQGWAAVETWGLANQEWLATFLELPHGIPSHDTFDRVFALLDPLAFEKCFTAFTSALVANARGLFVAVDGKTLRRSWKRGWSKTPVHLVSAFVSKNQTILGQLATDGKSNEITAIPKLLAMMDLAGATLTIDAMGCQREIAAQIRLQHAHYVLAVKDNQPTLHEKVKAMLDEAALYGVHGSADLPCGYFESFEEKNSHGRTETRRVWVMSDVTSLGVDLLALWSGLEGGSVVMVECERRDLGDFPGKDVPARVSVERRYFITSHGAASAGAADPDALAKFLGEGIRAHWGIENSLHWCLDVAMREDDSRIRVEHGAENFSRLRRIALNKLKRWELKKDNGTVIKAGIHLKQQACGWSREFLIQALLA
jgi:predicted transposase YbfD/YdcC